MSPVSTNLNDASLVDCSVLDIRFPFPVLGPGSDASNAHTTYSNPYVVLTDSDGRKGIGVGFSLGLGNEHICSGIRELFPLIEGRRVTDLFSNFREYWRRLANPPQRRWLGPYSGSHYMAAGALANALFDLVAKRHDVPLWRLLVSLSPAETVRLVDFRYVEHLLNPSEAEDLLTSDFDGREERARSLEGAGLPCYFTTWIGTNPADLVCQIGETMEATGIHDFKVKVGVDPAADAAKLAAIRGEFGDSVALYVDANQVWSPPQAVEWMRGLADYGVRWIEEPTAPDSIDGHRYVRERLRPLGIDVVTGENCPNSHVAAQFIASGAVDRFQIDACRVLGPAENMLIMLIAKKYGIPICPHAGGSGLDELVPHLSAWNAIALAAGSAAAITEHVALCSRHFVSPSRVIGGRLQLPGDSGYVVGMTDEAIARYRFPDGHAWK